jgi:hypothetical protein
MSAEGRFVLIVEGVDDMRRLPRLLPDLESSRDVMLNGNGFRGVRDTCNTLGSGFDQPFIGVCDRDLRGDEEIRELQERVPGLFFLSSRCLENELLYPPLLARALDMTGHAVTETEIRAALRTIADEQYEDVHAAMVENELRRVEDMPLRREDGATPMGRLRQQYEARRESEQNRLLAMAEIAIHTERKLRARWDIEHLALLDGKIVLPRIAQQFAPGLRGRRGLETAVLRHAIDFPPPGIAALRTEINRRRVAC